MYKVMSDSDVTSCFSPTSLKTILFGNQELSEAIDKQIIDIVHDYILKSKRFKVQ